MTEEHFPVTPVIDHEIPRELIAIPKAKKKDAHVRHAKRYAKAILVEEIKFVTVETAYVPSKNEMKETGHYVNFSKNPECDCSSFTFGYSSDPGFLCYHIIAARIWWEKITSSKTRDLMDNPVNGKLKVY